MIGREQTHAEALTSPAEVIPTPHTTVHFLPRLARFAAPTLTTAATLALLIAPLVWSIISVQGRNGAAWLPQAGPANMGGITANGARNTASQGVGQTRPQNGGQSRAPQQTRGNFSAAPGNTVSTSGNRAIPTMDGHSGAGALTIAGAEWDVLDPSLVQFLRTNQGDARYLVATTTSTYASIFMLATDQPALALGGYQGWDRILTLEQLAALARTGEVRYFYLSTNTVTGGFAGGTVGQDATVNLTAWVRTNCTTVPATQWQGTATSTNNVIQRVGTTQGLQLYDCASVATGQP